MDRVHFSERTAPFFARWRSLCDGFRCESGAVGAREGALTFLNGCLGTGVSDSGNVEPLVRAAADREMGFRFVSDVVDQLLPAYLPLLDADPPRRPYPHRTASQLDPFAPPRDRAPRSHDSEVDFPSLLDLLSGRAHGRSGADGRASSVPSAGDSFAVPDGADYMSTPQSLLGEHAERFFMSGGAVCESVTMRAAPLGSWRFALSPSTYSAAGKAYTSLRNDGDHLSRRFLYL